MVYLRKVKTFESSLRDLHNLTRPPQFPKNTEVGFLRLEHLIFQNMHAFGISIIFKYFEGFEEFHWKPPVALLVLGNQDCA